MIELTLVSTIFLSCLLFPQKDIIPWIPLSVDAPANIVERNKIIVSSTEINLPIYPGSYLTSYYPAISSNESEETLTSLATIFLVTADEIDKVMQFYRGALKVPDGWNLFEEYNVFVKGNLNDALSRTAPGIAIREETGESYDLKGADPKIVSSLKTRIKILYKP